MVERLRPPAGSKTMENERFRGCAARPTATVCDAFGIKNVGKPKAGGEGRARSRFRVGISGVSGAPRPPSISNASSFTSDYPGELLMLPASLQLDGNAAA